MKILNQPYGLITILVACVTVIGWPGVTVAADPDLAGFWAPITEPEDHQYRSAGPDFGDFNGIPFNEAGLKKAQSWNPDDDYLPENLCKPHSAPYIMRSTFPIQIVQEQDKITFNLESYEQVRTVYMDGRSHPGADTPHTDMGHSIGRWDGSSLVVDTTHFKAGYIRRNGAPHSDQGHIVERFARSGDFLMLMITLEDPVYLSKPMTRVIAFRHRSDLTKLRPYPCDD